MVTGILPTQQITNMADPAVTVIYRPNNDAQTHDIDEANLIMLDSLYATSPRHCVWFDPSRRSFSELKKFLLEELLEARVSIYHANKVDKFMSSKYDLTVDSALSAIFRSNINNEDIIVNILRSVMAIPYPSICCGIKMIAHTALSMPSPEVRRYAVQLLSRWGDHSDIQVLKKQQYKEWWLRDYVNEVVARMESKNG